MCLLSGKFCLYNAFTMSVLTDIEAPTVVLEVVARLNKLDKSSAEIARDAGVKESWLKMLRRGKIPNPGIRQFQRVAAYLDRVAA